MKRMRLPNGFGQISKIKKPLRNPYRAMVSVGTNLETGHKISKTIGYYRTYNDAYMALMEYHKDPYAIDNDITMLELHNRWFEEWEKNVANSTRKSMVTAWKRCSSVENIKVRDVRPSHIKACMDNAPTAATKNFVKVLFNNMLDYALEYGLIDHNYSRNFSANTNITVAKPHIAFTEEELNILWDNTDDYIVRMILIQCYMGWRPQELCNLLTRNVNIHTWTINGGMKTKQGKNRTVPIPEKIKWLVKSAYSEQPFLFYKPTGGRVTYRVYANAYDNTINRLGLNIQHRPHDPRKTFVTMAKRKGLDEFAIKYIVGHAITDLTEKVYTERDIEWLREQINIL